MDTQDNTCPVCHENIAVFAIGQCDHPICLKCSTRMRVLCEQMYCAICRSDLPEVLFVKKRDKYVKINRRGFIPHRRYKIFFEDFDAEEIFKKLQENRCKICHDRPSDKTFHSLKDHMRREHTLFCCDLCLQHLKIFSFERKFYNRRDLATHRRTGDEDDKSYKGHPLCRFCDERYMDNDELLRHLRKDHYFCHFCDEGSNEYYNDYEDLRHHFRAAHYLCEQDHCINVQFTNAFRTDIDLKAHMAKEHYHRMNKAQVKETRTIDVGFQLAPRVKGRARGATGVTGDDYEDAGPRGQSHSHRDRGGYRGGYVSAKAREERLQVERAREASLQEALKATEKEMKEIERKRREAQQEEEKKLEEERQKKVKESKEKDFPSLGGPPSVPSIVPPNLGKTTKKQSKPQSARAKAPGRLNTSDYPSLSGAPNNSSGSSTKVSRNTDRDSPILNPVTTPVVASSNVQTVPQSILDSMRKETPVVSKRAPKKTSEDFPTLDGGLPRPRSEGSGLVSLGVWSAKSKKNELNLYNSDAKYQENIPASLSSLGQSLCDTSSYKVLTGKRSQSPSLSSKAKSAKSKANTKSDDSSKVKAPPPKTRDKDPVDPPPLEDDGPKKNKKKKKQKDPKNTETEKEDKPSSAGSGKEGKTKKGKNDAVSKMFSEQSDRDSGIESSSGSVDSATAQAFIVDKVKTSPESVVVASTENTKTPASTSTSTYNTTNGDTANASLDCIAVGLLGGGGTKTNKVPVLDDFPSLNSSSCLAPPPGFKSSAPPGFGGSSSAPRPPPGFTASSGQEVTKSAPLSDYGNFVFSKPANFSARNKELVQNVSILLNNDQEKFSKFKSYSGSFRQGPLNALDYYTRCQQLLGQENFNLVVPELIALLPDIDKQQDLLSVHKDSLKDGGAKPNILKISGKSSKAPWNVAEEFKACPTCRQVLLQGDYDAHLKEHGDLPDFPTLGTRGPHPSFLGQGSWIKAK